MIATPNEGFFGTLRMHKDRQNTIKYTLLQYSTPGMTNLLQKAEGKPSDRMPSKIENRQKQLYTDCTEQNERKNTPHPSLLTSVPPSPKGEGFLLHFVDFWGALTR